MSTVLERVRNVIVHEFRVDESELKPGSLFVDDLNMDSLDIVNLLFALENEFSTDERGLQISDEEAEKLRSVQAVVDYLKAHGIEDG